MSRNNPGVCTIAPGPQTKVHRQAETEMSRIARPVASCGIYEPLAMHRAGLLGAAVYADYRPLLDDAGVDVVSIDLPHHLRYEVARREGPPR